VLPFVALIRTGSHDLHVR